MRSTSAFLRVLLGIGVFVLPSLAQRSTGTILGLVTDSTGGAVPEAAVTISNLGTGSVQTTNTNDAGLYTVTLLPVGRYQVKVTKTGFQEAQVKEVVLHVDENLRINVSLNVGSVTESVTVEATAPLLKTDSATVSQVVEEKRIVDMPLNGRNFQQLALLTPGVAVGTNFYGGAGYFTGLQLFSINGAHPDKTQYSFDGGDVTEQEIGGPTFTPPIDSIQEFSVMSGNFSAEFGHGGGVINLVTKSGANRFHGALWEFLRHDKLSARNFFAQQKAPLKRNQYGAAFGGPIRRDQTFFFANFENTHLRTAQTFVQTVPTARMHQGDFSELATPIYDPATTQRDPATGNFVRERFPGNIIPPNRIDSIAAYFRNLGVYPLPNLPGLVSNFVTNGPNTGDNYTWSARLDHRLTKNDALFGRFNWYRAETQFPGGLEPSPLGKRTLRNPAKNFLFNWVHTFSPNLQLEGRFNFLRSRPLFTSPIVGIEDFTAQSGIQGFEGISNTSPGYPTFNYSGYASFNGLTFNPNERTNAGYNYIANLSWIRSRHTLKFGTEIRRYSNHFYLAGVPRGAWSFDGRYTNNPAAPAGTGNGYADFLLGTAATGDRYRTLDRFYYTMPDYHFYAQDDFKVLPNLTLSYGLRYDLILPTRSKVLNMASFDPALKSPNGMQGAVVVISREAVQNSRQFITPRIFPIYQDRIVFADQISGYPKWLVETNWKNFAPRFGFSWKPVQGANFVVRGGYGIFYETPNGNIQSIFSTIPYLAREQGVPNDSPVPTRTLRRYFGEASFDPLPSLTGLPRKQPTPYEQQFNLMLQHQVTPNLVVEAGYVANLGRHMETTWAPNTPRPGPGPIQDRRPYPQFRAITMQAVNDGTFNYHSMQAKVEKRLSHGLTFLTSYTLSKHTGMSFSAYSNPMDPYNWALDYGLSDFDVTHNFTTSLNYALPGFTSGGAFARTALGGWEIGAIVAAYSGPPFTPTMAGDPANTGRSSRPDRIGSGELSNRTVDRWFDPSAFAVVPANAFRYGTAGRNILRGPGTFNLDLSVYKNFLFLERLRWQFRAEFFNLPNHPNFGLPFTNISVPATVGRITAAGPPRIVQFGLKMYF